MYKSAAWAVLALVIALAIVLLPQGVEVAFAASGSEEGAAEAACLPQHSLAVVDDKSLMFAQSDSRTVYIARSSQNKIYHYDSTCSGMRNPNSMTLDEAVVAGYRGCEKCVTTSSNSGMGDSGGGSNTGGSVAKQVMHRLYNPNSGEHFYTSDEAEYKNVKAAGWNDEGTGWTAPSTSGTPVYRLYNKYGGEHHYTTSASERDFLVKAGWNDEGVGWYSDDAKTVPLYREYNPNAFANNHNYTTSKQEHDHLVSLGWRDEGYAWYGV